METGGATSFSWWEPRATFRPQLRADLARMGLPRWDYWVRPTIIAGIFALVFLHVIHRTAPGVPLPTGTLRTVILALLYFPVMTLLTLLMFYTLPPFIIIDRKGVTIARGGSGSPIPWDRIASAKAETDILPPILTIAFTDRRGNEFIRMIGISRRCNPADLAQFIALCMHDAPSPPAQPATSLADAPPAPMPNTVVIHQSDQP